MTHDKPQRAADAADLGAAYAELRGTATEAKLLERAYGYYLVRGFVCAVLLLSAYALFIVFPATLGWSLLAALMIGFTTVQVATIGHDAGHRAVLQSDRANWTLGLVCWSLVSGVGFWYWRDRHNAHHAHANDAEDDPDLWSGGLVAFTVEEAMARRGWRRGFVRHQAWGYPFLLLLTAFALRVEGWVYAVRNLTGSRRALEVALLALNCLLWATAFVTQGWRGVGVFIGSQIVASLYLALIVAPNHKGMPVWTKGVRLSFVERQVLSSRNIAPNLLGDFFYCGLNYQIEHHLFPTMPRVNMARARALTIPFCAAYDLSYEELQPLPSYRKVLEELRDIGRVAYGTTEGSLA